MRIKWYRMLDYARAQGLDSAKAIGDAIGVSGSCVRSWQNGVMPRRFVLRQLCLRLKCREADIIELEDWTWQQ